MGDHHKAVLDHLAGITRQHELGARLLQIVGHHDVVDMALGVQIGPAQLNVSDENPGHRGTRSDIGASSAYIALIASA